MSRVGVRGVFCLWSCSAGGGWFGEALAGYEGEVDEVLGVLDGVDGGDGEDAFGLFGEGFGVFGGVGVDAGGEGFEVAAEFWGLRFEPLYRTLGDGVGEDPGVGLEVGAASVGSALLKYSEARPRDSP